MMMMWSCEAIRVDHPGMLNVQISEMIERFMSFPMLGAKIHFDGHCEPTVDSVEAILGCLWRDTLLTVK